MVSNQLNLKQRGAKSRFRIAEEIFGIAFAIRSIAVCKSILPCMAICPRCDALCVTRLNITFNLLRCGSFWKIFFRHFCMTAQPIGFAPRLESSVKRRAVSLSTLRWYQLCSRVRFDCFHAHGGRCFSVLETCASRFPEFQSSESSFHQVTENPRRRIAPATMGLLKFSSLMVSRIFECACCWHPIAKDRCWVGHGVWSAFNKQNQQFSSGWARNSFPSDSGHLFVSERQNTQQNVVLLRLSPKFRWHYCWKNRPWFEQTYHILMIKLKNIDKYIDSRFQRTFILKGVELEVQQGEFVTLMFCGAGKSTLMNIIEC